MRRLLMLLFLGLAIATAGHTAAFAQAPRLGHTVRWDLVQIVQGTLPGGVDVATDPTTGDSISLTGSGSSKPSEGDATGGGTFVHRNAKGKKVASGVYIVTGFVSWQPANGVLPPVADGIGHAEEASAGILTMNVTLVPESGSPVPGVLSVDCNLPGATFVIVEGVTLQVGPFHFVQALGATLFHVM